MANHQRVVVSRKKEQQWGFWFLLPIYPYQKRPTLRQEVIKDQMWIFDQPHGFLYAVVPIRMTVIKLQQGGLLVYCPIAPTSECIKLVRELETQHGAVKYIIHSTSSGLEHKIFVGPFARHFPSAQVWCVPQQWSFPLNLPLSWLGFPAQRTYNLPLDWRESPLADEFAYQIIDIKLSAGFFAEVALLHKSSQTLLVTDAVVQIPPEPPAIIELNSFPLLFHARETALDQLEDNLTNRLKGWQRICLFALYFRPSMIDTTSLKQLLKEARQAPNRSRTNYFGLYPFRWRSHWLKSFEVLVSREIPLVAPILQTLILPQDVNKARNWVNQISNWQFQQIIPAHFAAPIKATPQQFREAFSFLDEDSNSDKKLYPSGYEQIFRQDSAFVKQLEAILVKWKIAKPSPLNKG
jgi:hypothetical protein